MKRIELLDEWELPDKIEERTGYHEIKIIPEATSANMLVFFEKINELIESMNELNNEKSNT